MDVNSKLINRLSTDLSREGVTDSEIKQQYNKMKTELNNSYKPKVKKETKEATASGAAGAFVGPLGSKQETNEKWSEKYKKSINCNNPKGFSQRAHCQGRKKKMNESEIKDVKLFDLAKQHSKSESSEKISKMYNILKRQLKKGMKVEMEHSMGVKKAKKIAMDHLKEDPKY